MLELPGYEIEKQIGEGGMAKVYLALHKGLHRKVAIKVMAQHLSKESGFSDRFMREARIVASLSHQNIVTVHDVNVHNGYHYIAMEYLPGGMTLGHKIKQGLTPLQGIEALKQIASALGFAHSKGIVHRDVKPENIMFREDGCAVLTDFGIARSVDSATTITTTHTFIGTPYYMSPEQTQGQEIGPYTDIYSVGVVLYELLTGKVPYAADSTIDIFFKHKTEPVPTLEGALAIYQPVLNRMMAKRKEDRYQSCAEIVSDLTSLLTGGEVSKATLINATLLQPDMQSKLAQYQATTANTKPGAPSTAVKPASKNKLLIPGITASVLVIAASGSYFIFSAQQKDAFEQQQLAEREQQAQQKLAEQLAAKQAAEAASQNDTEKLAPQNATEKARLEAERERKQKELADLTAAQEAAKAKAQNEKTRKINDLLASAENNLLNSQLKQAYDNYQAIVQIDSSNLNAASGINRVAGNYLSLAIKAATANDFDQANAYITSAIAMAPTHNKLEETQNRVFDLRNAQDDKPPAPPKPEKIRRIYSGF